LRAVLSVVLKAGDLVEMLAVLWVEYWVGNSVVDSVAYWVGLKVVWKAGKSVVTMAGYWAGL
jgi:hypothetical protein